MIVNTNTLSPPDDEQAALNTGANHREFNDVPDPAVRTAAVIAETRAWMGMNFRSPTSGNRLQPIDTESRNPLVGMTPERITGSGGMLEQFVGSLFRGVRNPSEQRALYRRIRKRFNEVQKEIGQQGYDSPDAMSESMILVNAMSDVMTEYVRDDDVQRIAENILSDAHPTIQARFWNPVEQTLTEEGMNFLNRLRRNNANPAKVILAFSAALDIEHFDPGVGPLPPTQSGRNRISLTDLIDLPEAGITPEMYRNLNNIRAALDAYSVVPEDQLLFQEPGAAPTGARTSDQYYRAELKKYDRTRALAQTLANAIESLENLCGGAPPASLNGFNNTLGARRPSARIGETGAAPNRRVASAVEATQLIRNAMQGRNMRSADEYDRLRQDPQDFGEFGPTAIDHIWAEYVKRTGQTGDEQAKRAVAFTTDRAVSSTPENRKEVKEQAKTPYNFWLDYTTVWDERQKEKRANKDALGFGRRYIWPVAGFPLEAARRGLVFAGTDLPDIVRPETRLREYLRYSLGIDERKHNPMSHKFSMTTITDAYNTYKYLTERPIEYVIDPRTGKKKIKPEPRLIKDKAACDWMEKLKEAIVMRHLQNINRLMAARGIDRLSTDDANTAGLPSPGSFENMTVEQARDQLFGYLDGNIESATLTRIMEPIDKAWKPIGLRISKREESREWRNDWLWYDKSLEGKQNPALLNPKVALRRASYFTVEPVKAALTGESKFKAYNYTLGAPVKMAKGLFNWATHEGN